MSGHKPLIRAAQAQAAFETFSHPWNPDSEVTGAQLGRMAGLARTGVNIVRIPPGKESFVYHSHQCEEEWIYILSGRGVAEIDGEEHEVGPGDFMGFPTPSVAHHLRNPGPEDLVYLMGGESREVEIADFPRLGRRMVRIGEKVEIYDRATARSFESPEGD
ncbi:MAG: cupin domain-containing protein [Alphaproteobacteria bacterium]